MSVLPNDRVDSAARGNSTSLSVTLRMRSPKGATVATGGRPVRGDGLFYEPTVLLDVDESMQRMTEETFGPTLPIPKAADVDKAIRRTNDSQFGLAASIFTRDHGRGRAVARRIHSGAVNVNNMMTNVFQLAVPFGGQRHSGLGARHGGAVGIRKYCWRTSIIEERFNLPSEIYWYPTKARNIRLMTRAARLMSAGDWKRRFNGRTIKREPGEAGMQSSTVSKTEGTAAVGSPPTLGHAFQQTVSRVPERIALRTLRGEREVTWREYAAQVGHLAATLAEIGVTHGDSVAVMTSNRIEFHFVDTAIMHLGAVPVSIYNTLRPREIAYILENSGARLVFAESSYVPVLREIDDSEIRVIAIDGPAEEATMLADIVVDGTGFDLAAAAQHLRPDDLATISYTSGTTGAPKGVELSHGSILRSIQAIDEVFGSIDGARMVSFLPMAHVAERMFSQEGNRRRLHGNPLPTPERSSTLPARRPPPVRLLTPRLFEKLRAAIEVHFEAERDERRRALITEALQTGAQKIELEQAGRTVSDDLQHRYEQLRSEVLSPALALVGLD